MAGCEHSQQGADGEALSEIHVHYGGGYSGVSEPDRQRAGGVAEARLGWMGRALYLAAAVWGDACDLDAGRRRVRARDFAGYGDRRGWEGVCLRSGDNLALA